MKNTALITGASGGIGKEFAIIHAQKWGNLVLVARTEKKLVELKKQLESEHGVKIKILVKDLILAGSVQSIFDELQAENIEIDILINNAWFWGLWKFYERKWEKDKAMIDLNIGVLTELTRLFLPSFVEKNSWRVLNVSSTASLLPWPWQAVYYATKAYVTSFSNALAEELYDTNVTVTALLPWATETDFWKVSGMDKTKLFVKTANARDVALAWYQAMLDWKLNVIAGLTLSQKMLMKTLPFIPQKVLLKTIRKGQEVN